MTMYWPLAAEIPPIRAFPYPLSFRAPPRTPAFAAIASDPSVLPLSATIISPWMPLDRNPCFAFSRQTPSVSASLRQGITMVTLGWQVCAALDSASRVAVELMYRPYAGTTFVAEYHDSDRRRMRNLMA